MNPKPKQTTPKGGRKGGTIFPRIGLKTAIDYAKKLVAKTHSSSQDEKAILAGVFGSLTTPGKIKLSALKQFGLLEGDSKAYNASNLAKQIVSSPTDELQPLLQSACMKPPIFKKLFDAFHNGETSAAKIKQLAMHHKVHIESAEECVTLFLESLSTAHLCSLSGDQVKIGVAKAAKITPLDNSEPLPPNEPSAAEPMDNTGGEEANSSTPEAKVAATEIARPRTGGFQVSISIDPTMDPEKLEKHLKLLRTYGIC